MTGCLKKLDRWAEERNSDYDLTMSIDTECRKKCCYRIWNIAVAKGAEDSIREIDETRQKVIPNLSRETGGVSLFPSSCSTLSNDTCGKFRRFATPRVASRTSFYFCLQCWPSLGTWSKTCSWRNYSVWQPSTGSCRSFYCHRTVALWTTKCFEITSLS